MVRLVEGALDWLLSQIESKLGGCKALAACGSIHDLLAYETPKVARIRDAKLGLLYYILLGLIITYLVYQLGDSMEFLEMVPPAMSANLAFSEPVSKGCKDKSISVVEDPLCKEAFRSFEELDYCCTDKCKFLEGDRDSCHCSGSPVDVSGHACRLADALGASRVSGQNIFVKTYAEFTQQQRNQAADCKINEGKCDKLWITKEGTRGAVKKFTADIERFTLSIDHSAMLVEFGISSSLRQMEGYLKVGKEDHSTKMQADLCRERDDAVTAPWEGVAKPTDKAPCYIKPGRDKSGDGFEVEVLLRAMNVSLDVPGTGVGMDPGASLRSQGFVMNIEVVYFNSWPWNGLLNQVHYYYKLLPNIGSGYEESTYRTIGDIATAELDPSIAQERAVEVARGILVMVMPGGRLAAFSWQHLLLTFTIALGMLAVATFIVNLAARFVMRWGNYYSLMIYDTSGDFGRLKDIYAMEEAKLTKALEERGLQSGGNKDERVMRLLHDDNWTPQDMESLDDDEQSPLVRTDVQDDTRKKRGSSASAAAYGSSGTAR